MHLEGEAPDNLDNSLMLSLQKEEIVQLSNEQIYLF